jgi:ATP synthase protein I
MTWGGMRGNGSRPSSGRAGESHEDGRHGNGPPGGENAGWIIFSYMLSGLAAYGGIGWLVAHWTGHPLIFPLGMLVGLGLSIGAILHRYGRS